MQYIHSSNKQMQKKNRNSLLRKNKKLHNATKNVTRKINEVGYDQQSTFVCAVESLG